MYLKGNTSFSSAKAGKKDGKDWFYLRFLDNDADQFFNIFVDEEVFEQYKGLKKGTIMQLTINAIPGRKSFSLETLEIIK